MRLIRSHVINCRTNTMIEIRNVTFNYSTQVEHNVLPALNNVSLNIPTGQTIAIIGHNGSGKSTLANLLAAILRPQHGSITIDGLRTDAGEKALWAIRQRVGMVFQHPDDQLIASTVIDDVAFGPENLELPRQEIEQRVQEALTFLDLTEFAQASISTLSVSLKQRVAIAGVLAMRPRYLILDEPTTMISGHTARQLLAILQRIAHERDITIVHITHFMHEITTFDRVIVMDKGQILMDGTPTAVFARTAELQAVGLDVPLVTHLGHRLAALGWSHVPDVVLSSEQLLTDDISNDRINHAGTTHDTSKEPASDLQHSNSTSKISAPLPTSIETDREPVFELKEVFYTYQQNTPFAHEALRGLTLTIPTGRVTALVGPTGAGKSTLIDLLGGLIKPSRGVFLFGREHTATPSFKLERIRAQVGVVFQYPESQIFEETVGKDIAFGLRQKKVPLAESRRRVQESLEAVGLPYEDFRSRYTYALSGGQKRRVAIAGILALQPKIIIFDEPMAGLDPRGRSELFQLITALKQRNDLTIVYASSSLQEVIELADIIHVLDNGRLILSGPPRAILAQVDTLHKIDIALPEATQIALTLSTSIPTLRTDVLDLAELEEALLPAQSGIAQGEV
jgi:energy-coupling factor transport system ATP-binding protein